MKALKFALIGGVAVTAIAGFASTASAADAPSLGIAYNIGLASDYVFRGIDQSPKVVPTLTTATTTQPVFSSTAPFNQIGTVTVPGQTVQAGGLSPSNDTEVFGGIDLTYGGFYAGTWLSNSGPSDDEGLEYDIYGGYKLPVGPATLDLGVITYNYSKGSYVSENYNNYEVKIAGSIPVGAATLGAKAYWTPDFGGTGSDGEYYEANASYTLADKATVAGAVGYQAVNGYAVNGYTTWNVGVTYPVTDKVSLNATYIGTEKDASAVGPASRGKAVATVTVAF